MGERATSVLGALGMLAVFTLLMYTPTQQPEVTLPTSVEADANGYLGLSRWLQQSQIDTVSWRRRFADLAQHFPAKDGHILFTTYPYQTPATRNEVDALHGWVAQGNTLVVIAALNDSPDWTVAVSTAEFLPGIERLAELNFVELEDDQGEPLRHGSLNPFEPTPMQIYPTGPHPLTRGIDVLEGETDLISSFWVPTADIDDYLALELAVVGEARTATIWQLPYGDGFIIVSGVADLFTNAMLGEGDNAQFVANLIALHLADGASVIFDDYHQGLSELYDAQAFFGDPRLHNTLLFLLAFWFLYVVGASMRLGGFQPEPEFAHQRDYLNALAGFLQRKIATRDVGLLLVDSFVADMISKGKIDAHQDPWAQLRTMPLMDERILLRIHQAYKRLGAGEKTNLKDLTNHINNLRRRIG